MDLSVIIPVYNEVETLDEIMLAVSAIPVEKEIILVDDGSTDGSREKQQQVEQQMSDYFFTSRKFKNDSIYL